MQHFFAILNNTEYHYIWAVANLVRYPLQRYLDPSLYVFWILVTEGVRIPFCMAILYITIDHFLQLFLVIVAFFFSKHKVALSVCIYT